MPAVRLRYGKTEIPFEYDAGQFEILGDTGIRRGLTDAEINQKLDAPVNSPTIEDIANLGESVLIVVPDATRETGCGQIANLLVRRLIASGTPAHDIRVIFATGIHRKVTEDEKAAILTPFIAQRIKTLDHDPRDLMQLFRFGETSGGIPVELNRALIEHDHVILIGGVSFHYFAGFTGGRKMICPGLASAKTISATHNLAFDCEKKSRREGVGTGLLDGNAVHEAFVESVEKAPPRFAITTIVNDSGEVVDLFCGDWQTSHRAACEEYARAHTIKIGEKRDLVIASCGGFPHDINVIQAHKTLNAASHACRVGGTIILLAECSDGLGREDFLKWFDAENSSGLAETLCKKYQVNGQTAWNLMKIAERFKIKIVSKLDEASARKMGLDPINNFSEGLSAKGYLLLNGAKTRLIMA